MLNLTSPCCAIFLCVVNAPMCFSPNYGPSSGSFQVFCMHSLCFNLCDRYSTYDK